LTPKTQQALIVAAVAMAGAGLLAIAMVLDWIPAPATSSAPKPRSGPVTAAESLLPGETIVSVDEPKKTPEAAPRTPTPEQAAPPPPPATRRISRGRCTNCGTVSATASIESARTSRVTWEVRVRFDDGARRVYRFPTDPGYSEGDRVVFANGRLVRE
jgi:hypothetical protein